MIKNRLMIMAVFSIIVLFLSPAYFSGINPAFAHTPKVPVIILFKDKVTAEDNNEVQSNGGEIKRTYHIINGFAANLPQDKIEAIKNDPRVASVDLNVAVHALDLGADTQIRADQVWAKVDTGTGIPVAILDTGIDTTHLEFSGRILKCHSEITLTNICTDENGHGTHTAGIAAAAGVNLQAKGVAPSASLYIDQVLDSTGSGTIDGVIAGIDWAVTNKAKVMSMSLGTSPLSTSQPNCDTAIPSLTTAINNAVAAGVTVVAAAGNSGKQGVGAPGCISSTIAVGAVDSTDTIASFSSRGGAMTDHGIAAPGVNIFSSVPTGSCPLCDPSGYLYLSGTSMATPHVAGTVALMLKANPGLSPATIRSTLFNTACTSITSPSCPTGTVPNSVYGHGRVDALRAYNAVAAPTVPGAPTGLTATSGNAQVSLSWTAPSSNGGSAIIGYNVYRGTTAGGEASTPIVTVSGSTTSYTNTGLTNSQTYYYTVKAVNSVGISATSNEASATPATVPGVPTLTASAISSSQINLSWTTPANGGSPITGYRIDRAVGSGPFTTMATTGPTITTFSDTTVLASTLYSYQVYAINSIGTGPASNVATATTLAAPPPDFSLAAFPNSLTVQQGLSGISTVTVTSLNGFTGAVTLSLSGGPTGVTGSFSPNPTSTTSTLTITVGSSTPTGSYLLTVTGVSGSLTHTTTITLTVSAPPPPSGCQGECNN